MEFLAEACPKTDNSAPPFMTWMTLITFIMKIGRHARSKVVIRQSSPGWIYMKIVFLSRLSPFLIINSKILFSNGQESTICVIRRTGTKLFPPLDLHFLTANRVCKFPLYSKISVEFNGNLQYCLHTLGLRDSALVLWSFTLLFLFTLALLMSDSLCQCDLSTTS